MALIDHWPLFGLRITTPRLELRPPTDDDLDELVRLARAGIHDPAVMPFAVPWTDVASPRFEWDSLRYWWGCRSGFSPESWDLALGVWVDGTPVGVQNLAADDFPTLGVAGTGSWLGLAHQGRGIGKEMRTAVLHLAFECLGALDVTSTAFIDNEASKRVSLATGYELNGTAISTRRGERAEDQRFRITAERWSSQHRDTAITVEGFDACRPLFGLDD